ncbi:restriction endonuclease subunit S [Staphylococcus xylosus]
MNENKLTPSIRFKNNDGENYPEWDFVKVKEIASINTGNKDTKDAVENGQYDFYVRSPIVHKIDSFSYDGEAVLTVGDGVGVGKVFHYVNGKFDFHQRVYKISDFKDYYGLLFYYYFQKKFLKEAQKYNAKTSVDSVRKSMIADMYVPKIEMSEQIKIGNFFSKLDRQIELEEQKLSLLEEQKKGYMQQIFSQKLRFKDENGKDYPLWEIKKLGELYKVVMGQSPKSINYTDDNSHPVLVQGNADIYNGNIFPRMYTKEITKLVKKGDILLTVRAPVGEIGIAQFEACMGRGVCSIEGNKFIYYFLEMFGIQNKWQKLSQGSTFESISGNEVRNIEIPIPSPSEREKISDFFSELDHLINMHSQKVDELKLRKQGFLQKMFV